MNRNTNNDNLPPGQLGPWIINIPTHDTTNGIGPQVIIAPSDTDYVTNFVFDSFQATNLYVTNVAYVYGWTNHLPEPPPKSFFIEPPMRVELYLLVILVIIMTAALSTLTFTRKP